MTEPDRPSSEVEDAADLPRLADALPAAEHHCGRAVAHLEGRPARGDLLQALVALLEAAGGPDVGNGVRTHLERTGATVPARRATDRPRVRVLAAALLLHRAAEADLRDRLSSVGLVDGVSQVPDVASGRATRGRHAERVLAARRAAVDRTVGALHGGDLPAVPSGSWADALVADLPPDLSQGETGSGAAPR